MECKVTKGIDIFGLYKIGIYPEWNVKLNHDWFYSSFLFHWNISRMECKVTKTTPIAMDSSNWNISRMECKENQVLM